MKYSAIIVLANLMDRNGVLNPETAGRMDLAINAYKNGDAPLMVTCGWDYRDDSNIMIAEAMKRYAKATGDIPGGVVLTETTSRDTVGDAVFTKLNIANPNHWKNVLVVTSDYHVERTGSIFDFVYGDSIDVDVIGAETPDPDNAKASEDASLVAFNQTFEGIEKGHDSAIAARLCERHPFYNGDVYSKIELG